MRREAIKTCQSYTCNVSTRKVTYFLSIERYLIQGVKLWEANIDIQPVFNRKQISTRLQHAQPQGGKTMYCIQFSINL